MKFGFLYMMIGMYNIFNDMDKTIPGLKRQWNHRIRNTHFYDFHVMLNDIAKDRTLYRRYRDNIYDICVSRLERLMVRILLDFPVAKLVSFSYPKFLKLYRILSNAYILHRRTEF